MISFTYWPGKVPVLENTFGKCLEGTEYELSVEILQQTVKMIPPMETKSGGHMSHEDFTEFLVDIVEEDSLVNLWPRKRKVPQFREMLTELLVRMQKELAEQQFMENMLGGF
jgi:hypothetical protein